MKKKILIVEDDNILASAVERALSTEGFKTLVAIDGEDALKKAFDFSPDLILLDLILPKKSGEDVLAALKSDKATEKIPVLVATVKSENESVGKCIALGAAGYFIKAHYTLEEIVKAVRKALTK